MRILKHLTGIPGKKLPEKGPLGRGKLACGIAVLTLSAGTVASVYGDGLVSSVADQTWPSDQVYEYEYAPADVPSGLCVGTASPGGDDVPVTLRPCGVTSTVMWILLPQPQAIGHGYAPL